MIELLLSANGRLPRNRFWQGMVVLTVLNVLVVGATSYLGLGFIFALFLLIYPYACVIGKRLHDLGHSAWWVFAVFAAQFVFQNMLNAVVMPLFVSMEALVDVQREIDERLEAQELDAAMQGLRLQFQMLMPLSLFDVIVTNTGVAAVLGYMRSDPKANRFGPPS